MRKQFHGQPIGRWWSVGRRLAWLSGLLLLSLLLIQCGADGQSGSLDDPAQDAARTQRLEQQAVDNLVDLYQTALRQEDIDRLQELLLSGGAVATNARQAGFSPATTFRESKTQTFLNNDVIDLKIQKRNIRVAASPPTVSFVEVQSTQENQTRIQTTRTGLTTFQLARITSDETTTFLIVGASEDGPRFEVVTPGQIIAGNFQGSPITQARITVRETTGAFSIAAVEVTVPETSDRVTLAEDDGAFRGLFTPPTQANPQPLQISIRDTNGETVEIQHPYQTRLRGEGVVQPIVGTGATRFAAVTLAPDGTAWFGGVEPPSRGGVLYSVPPAEATARFEGNLTEDPTGKVEDLVFDRRGRLQAVVFASGSAGFPPDNRVVVFDQSERFATVNVFDPEQDYPFEVLNLTTGVSIPSPSVRLYEAGDGDVYLFGSDGGAARVGFTFRNGQDATGGVDVRFDPVFKRDTSDLLSNSVPALEVAADGALWFGTVLGLTRFKDGQFTPVLFNRELTFDGDVATLEGFFSAIAEAIFNARPMTIGSVGDVSFEEAFGQPLVKEDLIFSVVEDAQQRLWVATLGGGIRRVEMVGDTLQDTLLLTRQEGLISNIIFSLALGPDGCVWAATDEGVSRICDGGDGVAITNFSSLDGLALPVRDIAVDGNGTVWLATDGGAFRILQSEGLVSGVVRNPDGLALAGVDVTIEDTPFHAVTDAQGRFVMILPPGDHVLQFDASLAGGGPFASTLRPVLNLTASERRQLGDDVIMAPPGPGELVAISELASQATVATELALEVEVRDTTGQPVRDAVTMTFTVLTGDGALTRLDGSEFGTTLQVNTDGGRATIRFSLGEPVGANQVKASVADLAPVFFQIEGTADLSSARLLEVSGNNQLADPGMPLPEPLVVRLVDQFGNPLAGETVTAGAIRGTVEFLSAAEIETDEEGRAEFLIQPVDGQPDNDIFVEVAAMNADAVQFRANLGVRLFTLGYDVAVDKGPLLVVDAFRDVVVQIDPVTAILTDVSSDARGTGDPFSVVHGIAVEAQGPIFVVDQFPATVFEVNRDSGDRDIISSNTTGSGPPFGFFGPVAVAADTLTDALFVVDNALPAVFSVNRDSGERDIISSNTTGEGPSFGFFGPVAIAIDSVTGDLFVVDDRLDAVFKIDRESGAREIVSGCLDAACSDSRGEGPNFMGPRGIAILPQDGALIVTDSFFSTVFKVDRESGDRTVVTGPSDSIPCISGSATDTRQIMGTGPCLDFPEAVAVEANGTLVLADAALGNGTGAVLRVDQETGNRRLLTFLQP